MCCVAVHMASARAHYVRWALVAVMVCVPVLQGVFFLLFPANPLVQDSALAMRRARLWLQKQVCSFDPLSPSTAVDGVVARAPRPSRRARGRTAQPDKGPALTWAPALHRLRAHGNHRVSVSRCRGWAAMPPSDAAQRVRRLRVRPCGAIAAPGRRGMSRVCVACLSCAGLAAGMLTVMRWAAVEQRGSASGCSHQLRCRPSCPQAPCP